MSSPYTSPPRYILFIAVFIIIHQSIDTAMHENVVSKIVDQELAAVTIEYLTKTWN